jgi:hypothetical protein
MVIANGIATAIEQFLASAALPPLLRTAAPCVIPSSLALSRPLGQLQLVLKLRRPGWPGTGTLWAWAQI